MGIYYDIVIWAKVTLTCQNIKYTSENEYILSSAVPGQDKEYHTKIKQRKEVANMTY